jgi:N-acetylglucosaminyldiphosphoundecaprenol N-acetyl-beta-D-mannosaminyltransferase
MALEEERQRRAVESPAAPSVSVLGSHVSLVTMEHVIGQMDKWVSSPGHPPKHIVVTGFHGIWEAHKNRELHQVLNTADLWVADGIAPIWVARIKRILGARKACRTPGHDIMNNYFALANRKGYSSYFFGDREKPLIPLRAQLEQKYPKHRIAGMFSPPFHPYTEEENEAFLATINAAKPDVLWVGLGMPKQDLWIARNKARLNVPVVIGVGAAFSFVAGTVKRCPEWIGRCGFEWLYRFCREPRKLWRRDLLQGPPFLWHVGLELLGLKKYD